MTDAALSARAALSALPSRAAQTSRADLTRRTIAALARRQGGTVLRRQAQEAGLTRDQIRILVRRRSWLPLHHGVYFVNGRSPADEPPLLARLWAAHLRCGPSSVIGLGGAARLLRLQGLPAAIPQVDVILPRGRHPRPDQRLRPHVAVLGPDEILRLRGLPLTSATRTLADLLLRIPEAQALSLLDSGLHQGLTDLPALERALRYRPGVDRARALLPLADGRAESPLESYSRFDCIQGGVAPDELQYRVLDHTGRQLARTDFCWYRNLRRPLLGEADSRVFRGLPDALRNDRSRRSGPSPGNYTLLRFTWADAQQPGRIASLVRSALDELRVDRVLRKESG